MIIFMLNRTNWFYFYFLTIITTNCIIKLNFINIINRGLTIYRNAKNATIHIVDSPPKIKNYVRKKKSSFQSFSVSTTLSYYI